MRHNLGGYVTVRQDIKQVGGGNKIESGETSFLVLHESLESLFTFTKLLVSRLNLCKISILDRESNGELQMLSLLKKELHISVDLNEFVRFFG